MKQINSESVASSFVVYDAEALPTALPSGAAIGEDSIARRVNSTTHVTTNYYQYDGTNWNEV